MSCYIARAEPAAFPSKWHFKRILLNMSHPAVKWCPSCQNWDGAFADTVPHLFTLSWQPLMCSNVIMAKSCSWRVGRVTFPDNLKINYNFSVITGLISGLNFRGVRLKNRDLFLIYLVSGLPKIKWKPGILVSHTSEKWSKFAIPSLKKKDFSLWWR